MELSLQTIGGIIILGCIAGFLSGMVGIGGGIILVPALVIFFGLNQHTAQGTTLAMLSFPVSLVAAYSYHQKGQVDWRIALILCVGFIIGGYLGGKLVVTIPAATIKKIFAVIMIIIAMKFLFIDKS